MHIGKQLSVIIVEPESTKPTDHETAETRPIAEDPTIDQSDAFSSVEDTRVRS
jgi:hypothetical protein